MPAQPVSPPLPGTVEPLQPNELRCHCCLCVFDTEGKVVEPGHDPLPATPGPSCPQCGSFMVADGFYESRPGPMTERQYELFAEHCALASREGRWPLRTLPDVLVLAEILSGRVCDLIGKLAEIRQRLDRLEEKTRDHG
jgi:hypothetical protein